ncbi:MAG: TrmH family RNA methyltransferase [Candidatus Pacebacteria bacterium]|nr:TrmH family RNA methyltransferase [Candidatus Paceibacterota bacterium]
MKKAVILDNVRSVMNVGSIFRTANALKIEKIYLCGITPTPLDKYGNPRNDFLKVALGAEKTVKWEYVENTKELLKKLRKDGYYVIAIEQNEKAVEYKKINIEKEKSVAFLVGAEVEGLSKEVLGEASVIAEIPMLGTKESLNVTIAFAVATYRILGV